MTSRRALVRPVAPSVAIAHVRSWFARPHVITLAPGARHLDLLEGLMAATGANGMRHDWSPDGMRVAHDCGTTLELFVTDLSIPAAPITQRVATNAGFPAWAPNGSRIAYDTGWWETNTGIWTVNPDGTNPRQITSHGRRIRHNDPHWSPDSLYIVYDHGWYTPSTYGQGLQDIYRVPAAGGSTDNLTPDLPDQGPAPDATAWSPAP